MLLGLIVALQIARARWEEAVLDRAIPEYAAYRRQSPVPVPARSAQHLRPAARRPDGAAPFGGGHELGIRPACLVVIALPRLVG